MTHISPEGAADLALIRALRPPVLAPPPDAVPRPTGNQPEIRPLRSLGSTANSSAGTGQLPRQDAVAALTRTDGFAAGDHAVLPALRQLLRDSLAGAGSMQDIAERLIDRLTALLPPDMPRAPQDPNGPGAAHPGPTDPAGSGRQPSAVTRPPDGPPTARPDTAAAAEPQHGRAEAPAPRPFLPAPTGAPMAPGPQPILIPNPPPPAPADGAQPPSAPADGAQPPSPAGETRPGAPTGAIPRPAQATTQPAGGIPDRPGATPQPADGFPAVTPPQRQAVPPPSARFAAAPGALAPPVHLESLSTVFAPPVHPPNLPLTPAATGGSRQHEALLVPAPAGPPIIALAAKTAPPTMRDLRILLAGDPAVRREQVGQALTWLLDNLDRPQVVTATCAALGPALHQVGASPQRLDAMGVLVADALRATVGGTWRQEHYDAWHSSARLVTSWMGQGMARVDYEPAFWTATVVAHERRGDSGALLTVRTYLPYVFGPGQFATVESARHPQVWRPYWIASLPSDDNTLAIQVRVTPDDPVADALVNATEVGDRVRLRPALGGLTPDHDSARDLLLIAHDTGIAPMKALLADLRRYREVGGVRLLWTVGGTYDDDADGYIDIEEIAGPGASLVRLHDRDHLAAAVTDGDWTGCDVYVTGSPDEVRDAVAVLAGARVPADRIHQAALAGPQFEPVLPETA